MKAQSVTGAEHIEARFHLLPQTWDPWSLAKLTTRFLEPPPYLLAGGLALDCYCDRRWRPHGDTDLLIWEADLQTWLTYLIEQGWRCAWALPDKQLEPAQTQDSLPPGCSSFWARGPRARSWNLQFLIESRETQKWRYRRQPEIVLDWEAYVCAQPKAGISLVAPEVLLLFKSKLPRPCDHLDLLEVWPCLSPSRQARLQSWLIQVLAPGHPWRRWIG